MTQEPPTTADFATAAGTQRFAARHRAHTAADAYGPAGDLTVSSVGMGTYLGRADDATDKAYVQALVDAVRLGVNVLDTATSYRCQRSERSVGRALDLLIQAGEITRDELVVTSKAGFVPYDGKTPANPLQWAHERTVQQGLCTADELWGGCHCLAPDFVTAMVAQSLQNLGIRTLDVYFLHNPEAQLQTVDPALLEDRLRRAFASLEAAADAGHLQAYGVATWSGLRALPGERDHLSLERLVRCAHDVAGDRHRLRAVQLPISLGGPEALVRRDQLVQGEAVSALQAAARLGLTVFAAGPLLQGRLARTGLPSGVVAQGPTSHLSAAALALHFARSVPGVATALVGTSDRRHVVENAGLLRLDKASRAWVDEAARVPVGARLP